MSTPALRDSTGASPVPAPSGPSSPSAADALARVVGAGLLLASGGIHLDLYLTGYRSIPTIGWMFLLQIVTAFALGLGVLATGVRGLGPKRKVIGVSPQQLITAAGALFALATLAGYLLSLRVGLFGFREVRTTAGMAAGIAEIGAFLLLGWLATASARRALTKAALLGPLALVATVLLILAESSAASAGGSPKPAAAVPGRSEITIVIKDFAFHPSDPRARPGERILVENEDAVAHTFSTHPGVPPADAFTTGAIAPGGSKVVTAPSAPGEYPFLCLIHTFMTGTLIVTASG
ncbi:MAG TPA: cupredoxin domain-containing protein [Acidimicrobiales bacterium]|nr:cupredoxin domain-containing protein [Acidimicrobiales bacterium]